MVVARIQFLAVLRLRFLEVAHSPLGFPCGSAGKESACTVGDLGLIPGLGRSPAEGKATHSSILARRTPRTIESIGGHGESETTERL